MNLRWIPTCLFFYNQLKNTEWTSGINNNFKNDACTFIFKTHDALHWFHVYFPSTLKKKDGKG